MVSSSYRGFEYSGAYGGDGLFEVEHLFDAGHVIKLNRQLLVFGGNLPYYKVRQLFYYKVRQVYYKVRQVLQSATVITKCDSTDHISL